MQKEIKKEKERYRDRQICIHVSTCCLWVSADSVEMDPKATQMICSFHYRSTIKCESKR